MRRPRTGTRRAGGRTALLAALLGSACGRPNDGSLPRPADGPQAAAPGSAGQGWSMFGHDYGNSRAAAEATLSAANVSGLRMRWSWSGGSVTSTPAVVDGTVYFSDWRGNLVALVAASGAPVWSTSLQSGMLSPSPFVTADAVYTAGDRAMVHAVDRASGTRRWSRRVESTANSRIWSSPVVVDGTLIVGIGSYQVFVPAEPPFRGSVVGLDAATGEEKWRARVCLDPCTGVSVWSSAAVDRDRGLAFIGTGQSYSAPAGEMSDSLVAIDYRTGAIAWHHQFTPNDTYTAAAPVGPDHDVGASPNLFTAGGRDLVGVGDKGGVYKAFDRATGVVVWERRLTPGSPLGGVEQTTAYADGVVYVVSNVGVSGTSRSDAAPSRCVAFALDAATGNVLWSTSLSPGGFGGVAVANQLVYFTTHEGTLHALDARDGRERLARSVGASSASGPSIAGGLVFVGHGWDWGDGPSGGLVVLGL